VWYQCFLGIQPDLLNGVVTVKPMLPKGINRLSLRVKLGKGYLIYNYKDGKFDIRLDGLDAKLQLILPEEGVSKNNIIPFCKPDNTIILKLFNDII
jgi:hypothetical protein